MVEKFENRSHWSPILVPNFFGLRFTNICHNFFKHQPKFGYYVYAVDNPWNNFIAEKIFSGVNLANLRSKNDRLWYQAWLDIYLATSRKLLNTDNPLTQPLNSHYEVFSKFPPWALGYEAKNQWMRMTDVIQTLENSQPDKDCRQIEREIFLSNGNEVFVERQLTRNVVRAVGTINHQENPHEYLFRFEKRDGRFSFKTLYEYKIECETLSFREMLFERMPLFSSVAQSS